MMCWCLGDTELWTWDWWLWGSECPQWVVSVLDKYRVSLSLSHHPNIIITGWYRDSRSHQTMQTDHIFLVKLFCLFVWMFCTRVIGMQSTLCLCSRRSFIYGLTPSLTRSKTWDPRIKMWLLVTLSHHYLASWWAEHLPGPDTVSSHHQCQGEAAKCADANLL